MSNPGDDCMNWYPRDKSASWWEQVCSVANHVEDPRQAVNLKRLMCDAGARTLLTETVTTKWIDAADLVAYEVSEPFTVKLPWISGSFRLILNSPPPGRELPSLLYIRRVDQDGNLPPDYDTDDIVLSGEPFDEGIFEDGIGEILQKEEDRFGEMIGAMAADAGVESVLP